MLAVNMGLQIGEDLQKKCTTCFFAGNRVLPGISRVRKMHGKCTNFAQISAQTPFRPPDRTQRSHLEVMSSPAPHMRGPL